MWLSWRQRMTVLVAVLILNLVCIYTVAENVKVVDYTG